MNWKSSLLWLIQGSLIGLIAGCAAADPQVRTRDERDQQGTVVHTRSYYLVEERGTSESVLHGAQIDWYPDGKRHREVNFVNGVRHGYTMEWDKAGTVVRKRQFVDGEKVTSTGPVTKSTRVKQPAVKSAFHGWVGGTLSYEQLYDAKEQLVGIIHRSDGVNIARCIRSEPDADGRYHRSDWVYWSPEGDLLGTGVFRDGLPQEGICFVKRQDGSLAHLEFGRYRNGKLLGTVPAPVAVILGETPVPPSDRK